MTQCRINELVKIYIDRYESYKIRLVLKKIKRPRFLHSCDVPIVERRNCYNIQSEILLNVYIYTDNKLNLVIKIGLLNKPIL